MVKNLLFLSVCFILAGKMSAQQAIGSAGGSTSTSTLSCTFVFGQMIAPDTNQSGYVFYPAVLFSTASGSKTNLSDVRQNNSLCYVTGNDILHLIIQGTAVKDMSCEIYSVQGVACFKGEIKMNEQEISVANYPAGVYIIIIKEKNQITETIKFIKK